MKISLCKAEKKMTVATRSKAYVCGRFVAGIAVSNPSEGMAV
jgi:hypothetical protein